MAYSEEIAERIREVLKGKKRITEKKMFGGLAFMDRGNLIVGVMGDTTLVARVGPEQYEDLLEEKNVGEMTFTGRPMRGLVYVHKDGFKTKPELKKWLDRCLKFTQTHPEKKK